MSKKKLKEFLNQEISEIIQELSIALEKKPMSIDDFVKELEPNIESDKTKLSADSSKKFLGGELEVFKIDDRFFGVRISYYLQDNEGNILELNKEQDITIKKHVLKEEAFEELSKNSIKYPIS